MALNFTCSPGQDATAGYFRIADSLPALVLYLDPLNFAIQLPPFAGGELVLARFCRELAEEAIKLADAIDPRPTGPAAPAEPRHLLRPYAASEHRPG